MVFSEPVLFIGGEQGLYQPRGVGSGFWAECTLQAGAEELEMLHLHEEEFQVLVGHVPIGKEED